MEITLVSDLVSTLVDARLVEGLLDKKGPWVMLGVFTMCVACWGDIFGQERRLSSCLKQS